MLFCPMQSLFTEQEGHPLRTGLSQGDRFHCVPTYRGFLPLSESMRNTAILLPRAEISAAAFWLRTFFT